MNGFLNLYKPSGLTSHDCVSRVRRRLGLKRVGHGGTLDPAATGVLPIAVGRATRLLQFLPTHKAYRGTVRFGVTTTTDDLAGEVITQQSASHLTLDKIAATLPAFEGRIKQIPPKYSAIQVGGKRLYDLARAGEAVEVPVREVEIFGVEVLGWSPGTFPELQVAIACGSGTYIRAIARDLGALLGVGGTLAALERTASGGFEGDNSISLEAIAPEQLISPAIALAHLPQIVLESAQVADWGHGRPVVLPATAEQKARLSSEPSYVQVTAEATFLGVAQLCPSEVGLRLRPKVVWPVPPQGIA